MATSALRGCAVGFLRTQQSRQRLAAAIPLDDPLRQGWRLALRADGGQQELRIDRPARAFEYTADTDDAEHAILAHEAMLEKSPAMVPAEQSGVNLELLEHLQIAPEFCNRITDDRNCALAARDMDRAGAQKPVQPRDVREREVTAIVYVQVQVEIVRIHVHADARRIEHPDARGADDGKSDTDEA